MRWLNDIGYRVRALFGRKAMERELEDEISFHLEMEARKLEARGMSPVEARRMAAVKFGGADRFKEQARASWGVAAVTDVGADLRFARRQLGRHPAFTAMATLTLALGIGGTVALFSVVDGLLLRPLPVQDEDDVMVFWSPYNWRAIEFDFARGRLPSFDALEAFTNEGFTLRTDEGSSLHLATLATAELFDVLGTQPLVGRTFLPEDDRPGAEPVIVLSHGLWQQAFGGDPGVVGTRIDVSGRPTTVVGVMPRGFYFPTPEMRAWIPLEMDPESESYQNNGWLALTGRLGAGAPPARVQADLEAFTAALRERWTYNPSFDKTRNPVLTPLREYVMGDVRPLVLLLLGAVGVVLLMACVNVAALLLAKASDRTGEMAVRAALGAGRLRLSRQMLTESVVLGIVGGAVGVGLAVAAFDLLVAALPLPSGLSDVISLDWSALAAGLVLSVGAGAMVALAPMRRLLRGDLSDGALGSRRQAGLAGGGTRTQKGLVVAEVLLCVVLTTGAALLVRTVDRIRDLDAGVEPKGMSSVDVFLPVNAMDEEERARFFRVLVERVEALPGVTAAGLINRLPVRDGGWQGSVTVEDRPDLNEDGRRPSAYWRPVTPGTFRSLGARVVQGRGIEDGDRQGATAVVVVNQAFARSLWGDGDPLGRRVATYFSRGEYAQVVGVVADVAIEGLTGEVPPTLYVPWDQGLRSSEYGILTVRTDGDVDAFLSAARSVVAEVDPRAAVGRMVSMTAVMDDAMAEPLRLRFFLSIFAALGIVLGTVGIYGVVSYSVQRRRGEFGVRMALGAEPRRLLAQVVRDGMTPVLLGVAGGLGVALVASATLERFLYEVAPTDIGALAAAAGVLTVAGLLAAMVPAWRAGRTEPSAALRGE